MAGSVLAVIGVALVGRYGDVLPVPELGPLWGYVDALAFGGLLGRGNLVAPALGSMLLGRAVGLLAQPALFTGHKGFGLEYLVAAISLVGLAGWMALTPFAAATTPATVALALVAFPAMVLLGVVLRRITWTVANESDVDLLLLWVAYTVGFTFLQRFQPSATEVVGWSILAMLFLGLDRLNRATLTLVSSRVSSYTNLEQTEEVETPVSVDGGVGVAAYLLGVPLVLSGLATVQAFVDVPRSAVEWLVPLGFLAVVVGWSVITLRRRLAVDTWRAQLNARRQLIRLEEGRDVADVLGRLQLTLQWREVVGQVVLIGAPCALLLGETLPGTSVPAGPALAASAAITGWAVATLVGQMRVGFLDRTVATAQPLDFSLMEPDHEPGPPLARRLRQLTRNLPALATALVFVVQVVFQILSRLVDLADIWAWLQAAYHSAVGVS